MILFVLIFMLIPKMLTAFKTSDIFCESDEPDGTNWIMHTQKTHVIWSTTINVEQMQGCQQKASTAVINASI